MLRVDTALRESGLTSRVLLQVHDELVLDVAEGEEEQLRALVTEGMGSPFELSAPLEVGIGVGANWLIAALWPTPAAHDPRHDMARHGGQAHSPGPSGH